MDEQLLLGELKEFKRATLSRLENIEKKVDSLDKFKVKVTLIMVSLLGTIELSFRIYEVIKK